MNERGLGVALAIAGGGLLIIGLLLWSRALGWFGRLPGDLRFERDGVRVYVPIVSMIVVSLVLSALLWLVRRLS